MLLLYAVILGVIGGLATRGSFAAIGTVKVRLWPVALLGLAFQALLFSSPLAVVVGKLGPSLYVLSTTLVLMALVVNLRQPGFWLITLGALANFTVIIANGGQMPASPDAFAALNGVAAIPTTDFSNSVLAGPGTAFAFLGDNFVLPRPIPFANVFSIGDVLIGVGGAWFIVAAMHAGASAKDPLTSSAGIAGSTPTRPPTRTSSRPTHA
jgi:hypothetical protein